MKLLMHIIDLHAFIEMLKNTPPIVYIIIGGISIGGIYFLTKKK